MDTNNELKYRGGLFYVIDPWDWRGRLGDSIIDTIFLGPLFTLQHIMINFIPSLKPPQGQAYQLKGVVTENDVRALLQQACISLDLIYDEMDNSFIIMPQGEKIYWKVFNKFSSIVSDSKNSQVFKKVIEKLKEFAQAYR